MILNIKNVYFCRSKSNIHSARATAPAQAHDTKQRFAFLLFFWQKDARIFLLSTPIGSYSALFEKKLLFGLSWPVMLGFDNMQFSRADRPKVQLYILKERLQEKTLDKHVKAISA